MIDIKQAIRIAKANATDLFGEAAPNVEEIERETYNNRDSWSITLSLQRFTGTGGLYGSLGAPTYKRFLIDIETGDLLGVKIRELASQ